MSSAEPAAPPKPLLTQADMQEKTRQLLAVIGEWSLDTGIIVLTAALGQMIAGKAGNVPGQIEAIIQRVGRGLKASAVNKMIHDDNKRREG